MDYLYTKCLLAPFRTPTVSPGTDAKSSREHHSSSFISSYSYGLPDWSVFLESNHWDPINMYQNNVSDADSG